MPVEEMPDAGQHHQLRRRFKLAGPVDHQLAIDDFIRIALHDQPGTTGHRHIAHRTEIAAQRWRNGDHPRHLSHAARRAGTQRHHAAERKAREPQCCCGPALPAMIHHGQRVLGFAAPFIEAAGAAAHTAKIETDAGRAQRLCAARQRGHHLVGHRAAMQRMRVTHDHEGRRRNTWCGIFDQRLQRPGGTCDFNRLGAGRRRAHSPAPRKPSEAELMQ